MVISLRTQTLLFGVVTLCYNKVPQLHPTKSVLKRDSCQLHIQPSLLYRTDLSSRITTVSPDSHPGSAKPESTSVSKPDTRSKKKGPQYTVPLFDFDKAPSEHVIPDAQDVSLHHRACCSLLHIPTFHSLSTQQFVVPILEGQLIIVVFFGRLSQAVCENSKYQF